MEKFCLKDIYSRLGDDESRFLFEKRLCYSLTGDRHRMVHAINEKIIKKPLEIKKYFYIFGAGAWGHDVVRDIPEIPWHAFIDNDKSKAGKPDILPIISFREFIANSENSLVFICNPLYGGEMKRQLINNGFPEDSIIFVDFSAQYFDLPYFKPQENEFFIDAGGYDGVTTKSFFQWLRNNRRKDGGSVIFEPNPILYDVCKHNLKNCDNVKIENKGLWHKSEHLNFMKNQTASRITTDGEETIETISLDEYLKNEKNPVTFIKMDIEGAELNALKGAERTIREQKPKLAISIYHKPEDIWEIPSLLLDFVPDYKFYIRHYTLHGNETVLYAQPS